MTKAFLDPRTPPSRFNTDPAHTPEIVTNHNFRNLIAERGVPPYSFGTYEGKCCEHHSRFLEDHGGRDQEKGFRVSRMLNPQPETAIPGS